MKYFVEAIHIYPEGVVPDDFPEEAVEPGLRFENSSAWFSDERPKTGDRIQQHGREWEIWNVFYYQAQHQNDRPTEGIYQVWCYSPSDTIKPMRQDWQSQQKIYGYYHANEDGSIQEDGNGFFYRIQALGSTVRPDYGKEIYTVQAFQPTIPRPPGGYDQIFLYWCRAAAIAA